MMMFPALRPSVSPTGSAHPDQTVAAPLSSANLLRFLQPIKLKSRRPPGRNNRLAAAAVEFAFIAPLLVTLILAMIEFGRVMMVMEVLTNAAREGCRVGVLPGSTTSDVTTHVNNYLTESSIQSSFASTTVYVNGSVGNPSSAAAGDQIKVTISLPFNNVSWLPVPLFMGGKTMSSSVVMRKESNNT
jgi:Flp pilus assembly protein TadG